MTLRAWILRIGCTLLMLTSIFFRQPTANSMSDSLSGQPVNFTPFDTRMRNAGLFGGSSAESSALGDHSIDTIFNTARSFRYVADRGRDNWQTDTETQSRRAGDCEDKAVWLYKNLIAGGAQNVRLVIGRYRQMDRQLHVWVTCRDRDGNTCLLDPSKQRRVWKLSSADSGLYRPLYGFDGRNKYKYFGSEPSNRVRTA